MVSLKDLSAYEPFLDLAIDRHPLVVSPETLVADVVVLMSQTRGLTCTLSSADEPGDGLMQEARSSCVLIMQGRELLGIFTERDIVRLTANDIDLTQLTIGQVMIQPVITLAQNDFCHIFAALFLFRRHQIRHLVVVDDQNNLVGVVSPESIRQVLKPTNLLKLRRVREVMTQQVIHAAPTTSVIQLAQQMANHRVSCIVIVRVEVSQSANPLFVLDDTQLPVLQPIGIITERDVVQFQALGLDLAKTTAQEVMSGPLFLAGPEDSLWIAHQEMQRRRVQRLVVSWNWGTCLGLVTQRSLLRVFDPVEMYGVIETLQQSLPDNHPLAPEADRSRDLLLTNSFLEDQRSREHPCTTSQASGIATNPEVSLLLQHLQDRLERLADHPEFSSLTCRVILGSALVDLQKICSLILDHYEN